MRLRRIEMLVLMQNTLTTGIFLSIIAPDLLSIIHIKVAFIIFCLLFILIIFMGIIIAMADEE